MTDIHKSDKPLTDDSKFPKWVIYIFIAIIFGIFKGGMKSCIREKTTNDAINKYNQSK